MTVKKKPKKKPVPGVEADETIMVEEKIDISREDLKKMVAKVAESKSSYREIADEIYKKVELDRPLTQPTIGKYLEEEWGKDFQKKKAEMSECRSMRKKWDKEFERVRSHISKQFHKDYVSKHDGLVYNKEKNILEGIPVDISNTLRRIRKKNIITFVSEGELSVLSSIKKQLERKIKKIAQDKYKRLEKKTFDDEMDVHDAAGSMKGMNLDERDIFQGKVLKEVRKSLKPEKAKIDKKAKKDFKSAINRFQKDGIDNRNATLLGRDLLDRKFCPIYKDKKGKMLTMKGINPETGKPYEFSRVGYNILNYIYSDSLAFQKVATYLAGKLPELLYGEDPIVQGKQNDILGVNLRVRLPRNLKEDILTREAGIVITEAVAKKFRYFNVVEKGHIIAESVGQLPQTWRVNKLSGTMNPIETHYDFKARVNEALEVQRGDPLTFSSFKDLDGNPGYKEAKHSGQLIYLGQPKNKYRNLTVDKDKDPQERSKIDVDFIIQEYIIVREDDPKIGDVLLTRTGLEGAIVDIVKSLGKDKENNLYEIVINQDVILPPLIREHEASDGQIFFFLPNKFAQDQSTSGLRMSTTMLSGLWEWFLYDIMDGGKKYTQSELNKKLEEFVGQYFGDKGTFVPSLKAMHYKAVKKKNKVKIEIDEREPLPDRDGEVIYLPHTCAGRTYEYCYIPNFIPRIYFDGSTLREYYQIDSSRKGITSESSYYYQFIMRQVKNRMHIFPRNEDAVSLVVASYYGNNLKDYDEIIMDLMDFINAGGNPYDKNPTISFYEESMIGKNSIQTHLVNIDKTGKYGGCIKISPIMMSKAGLKCGDQVVVFTPAINYAKVKLDDEELKEFMVLEKKKYTIGFNDFYDKVKKVKQFKTEKELRIKIMQHNQDAIEKERSIKSALKRLSRGRLLFYGSELHEPIKIGKNITREFELTPEETSNIIRAEIESINNVGMICRETWRNRSWDNLDLKDKNLRESYYKRLELNRRMKRLITDENLEILDKLLRQEDLIKIFAWAEMLVDPIGLEIQIGNRLVDRIIWQQLKESDILTVI